MTLGQEIVAKLRDGDKYTRDFYEGVAAKREVPTHEQRWLACDAAMHALIRKQEKEQGS